MPKPRSRLADLTVYFAVRLAVCLVQALPPRLIYPLADALAWAVFVLARRRCKIALENIRHAFPELAADPVAANRLVRATFRHFSRALLELMLVPRKVHTSTLDRYIVYPAASPLRLALADDRALVIATAHFGNWELAGVACGLCGHLTHAVARVQNNPYLERYVQRLRAIHGQELIAKNGDFTHLAAVLAAGGKVAMLADQDAGTKGLFVNFFGRPASTHKALALIALKYDALIVVTGMPRVNRADFLQYPDQPPSAGLEPLFHMIVVEDVIDPRDYAGMSRSAAVSAITRRYAAALERLIRRHPEQYFWFHRRWKTQPPQAASSQKATRRAKFA